ncbi:hypothetical protein GWK47_051365 [Chionoecetes opilio]|uniref:Uncharacterized protein n=1 Tax=Chionoecetes opilio TaxID=41210 RepID=A0A8J5CSE3_CHIOP|nr:hypothetical protein GWK47_051365 [Chionoecetes opilio]
MSGECGISFRVTMPDSTMHGSGRQHLHVCGVLQEKKKIYKEVQDTAPSSVMTNLARGVSDPASRPLCSALPPVVRTASISLVFRRTIHPRIKLPVVFLLNPEKVDTVIARLLFEVTEQAVLDTSEGSSPDEDKEDDFFKLRLIDFIEIYCIFTSVALMSPRPTATEGTNSTRLSNKMGKELESWYSEKQRNKLLEQAMFTALSHAAWVHLR